MTAAAAAVKFAPKPRRAITPLEWYSLAKLRDFYNAQNVYRATTNGREWGYNMHMNYRQCRLPNFNYDPSAPVNFEERVKEVGYNQALDEAAFFRPFRLRRREAFNFLMKPQHVTRTPADDENLLKDLEEVMEIFTAGHELPDSVWKDEEERQAYKSICKRVQRKYNEDGELKEEYTPEYIYENEFPIVPTNQAYENKHGPLDPFADHYDVCKLFPKANLAFEIQLYTWYFLSISGCLYVIYHCIGGVRHYFHELAVKYGLDGHKLGEKSHH